ncbi:MULTISPECIES: glucokinase [Halomonas]|uniref:glucokinase n=1 Tax=Halomonas TaxID=2745 RepID=UPI001C99EE68|nr:MULTISPECIES: glucokinase [Halomonas]MBY5968476.1 glucokinase [Halomonas denitrificans]MBY5984147.1 glucokinase [Halomonas sp. DP5Y7-2]
MTRQALIGDIGGTNARFALVSPDHPAPHHIMTLPCADYPGVVEAVQDYLGQAGASGQDAPKEACLAFACPVHAERVSMSNNHWDFLKSDVRRELGLDNFKVINDFMAQALGVPHVAAHELVSIQTGDEVEHAARLVIGPGTGLGMAGVFPARRAWVPLPNEGGHASFAPTDELELDIYRHFHRRYGRVSVERILCGQGLLDLYRVLADMDGQPALASSPAEVTSAANSGDPLGRDTILRFLKILGDVSGDAALTLGARGGVYLCGGIVPRLVDWLPHSGFLSAFSSKGRMRPYNEAISIQVVKAPWTGLLGAAEALHNEEVE